MKNIKYFIIIIFLFSTNLSNAQENDLQNKITKNLRCLICQGQSVYDSDSEFALSLRLVISNKISEGMTEEQIYSFLKKKIWGMDIV